MAAGIQIVKRSLEADNYHLEQLNSSLRDEVDRLNLLLNSNEKIIKTRGLIINDFKGKIK